MFGTSRCKKCTNYWLFLIPAFAIAGLLLVLVLFVFNLTVVDGDINGFILMVSGLSIHSSRVFPSTYGALWVLVSLCNLDLGFEVCFYNGMTSYAATWLSFIFPAYVLLIIAMMALNFFACYNLCHHFFEYSKHSSNIQWSTISIQCLHMPINAF